MMNIKRNTRNGVSGIMRVKNDAEFIAASIDSCIDALDELIIVYNDCSDDSPDIIEQKRCQYPDKIKVYEYKHKIYSINLTKEEYDYAKSLPADSPHLLCNYYNFALSKVTCKYAMKVDADQIYFTEKLRMWCDVFRSKPDSFSLKVFIGGIVWAMSRIRLKWAIKKGSLLPFPNRRTSARLWPLYQAFLKYWVHKKHVAVSMSGVDVVRQDKEWYVTMGKRNDIINILPPYNGVGDHLIFEVSEKTYYAVDDCEFYRKLRSESYSLIERFVCPFKSYYAGLFWYHLNAMRDNVKERVAEARKVYPDYFVSVEKFVNLDYDKQISPKMDKEMVVPTHSWQFQAIHEFDSNEITKNIHLIKNIK